MCNKNSSDDLSCLRVCLFTVAIMAIVYIAWIEYIPVHENRMAQTLGALFTGLAFAAMIGTLLLQRQDLKETREELKRTADANSKSAELAQNNLRAQYLIYYLNGFNANYQYQDRYLQITDLEIALFKEVINKTQILPPVFKTQQKYEEVTKKYSSGWQDLADRVKNFLHKKDGTLGENKVMALREMVFPLDYTKSCIDDLCLTSRVLNSLPNDLYLKLKDPDSNIEEICQVAHHRMVKSMEETRMTFERALSDINERRKAALSEIERFQSIFDELSNLTK